MKYFKPLILLIVLLSLSPQVSLALMGTPERVEHEIKLSFSPQKSFSPEAFLQDLIAALKENKFQFPQFMRKPYKFILQNDPTLFNDHYYDTKNGDLYKRQCLYRLRSRFDSFEDYYLYKVFPFDKLFQPRRIEVQSKRPLLETNTLSRSIESRLEFRKESLPFSNGFPLPSYSNFSVFQEIALSGHYKKTPINPFINIERCLPISTTQQLLVSRSIITQRWRAHLELGPHPWASGPNPNQVIIISLDKVIPMKGLWPQKAAFWELEIEIDRNIFTELQTKMNPSKNPMTGKYEFEEFYAQAAPKISKLVFENIKSDLDQIRSTAYHLFSQHGVTQFQPLKSKYRRLIEATLQ